MSRSIPCPPSAYARNWANGQNLVESTKIEKVIVDPKKALRKEKEKRKDKKDKPVKSKKSLEQHTTKFDDTHLTSKKIQDENEQLEKSGLTEELEQPQNLCYLSDGSQSNNKRKRQDVPTVESHAKAAPGKPLRIRFVFRKPKVPEAVPQDECACSTSGAQCLTQNEKVAQGTRQSCVPKARISEQEETLPSTSQGEEGTTIPVDTKKKKHKKSKESRYNALFEEWIPSALSALMDVDDDDQDWLFSSKRQERLTAVAAAETDNDSRAVPCVGDPSWRRAQFLPEVGIYSLPYTIPF